MWNRVAAVELLVVLMETMAQQHPGAQVLEGEEELLVVMGEMEAQVLGVEPQVLIVIQEMGGMEASGEEAVAVVEL